VYSGACFAFVAALARFGDRGRGQRQHFLRRGRQPDGVGGAFGGLFEAFGRELERQLVLEAAEDRDPLGAGASDFAEDRFGDLLAVGRRLVSRSGRLSAAG
jgi:hypothetical protein